MADEIARMVDQMQRAHEGEAWHGPSLRSILADVTAEQANARPIGGGHTIAEILLHIATWDDVVRRRLDGERIVSLPRAEDWPAVPEGTAPTWVDAVRRLEDGQRRLRASVARLDASSLERRVDGKDYTVYVMLHGIVQHELYHGGQISLLKKAGSRGSR